jgi:hypothetical protein
MTRARVTGAIAACLLGGCALTSKSEPTPLRWFTPETGTARLTSAGPDVAAPALALRLGRITSGNHLRERIVHRESIYEVGLYEDLRWTERPEIYVRRELTRALFQDGRFRETNDAPTLDVEVLAFDELRLPRVHAARVAVALTLHREGRLLEETLTVDEPIAGELPVDFVASMGRALRRTGEIVAARLREAEAMPPAMP